MSKRKKAVMYSKRVRQCAVKELAQGAGHRALATACHIPDATARQWARAYAAGGAPAVMNAGKTHRMYSFALKLAAVKDRLERGLTVREVMVKYGVPSDSSIKSWCRLYRAQGEGALLHKARGRKPKSA